MGPSGSFNPCGLWLVIFLQCTHSALSDAESQSTTKHNWPVTTQPIESQAKELPPVNTEALLKLKSQLQDVLNQIQTELSLTGENAIAKSVDAQSVVNELVRNTRDSSVDDTLISDNDADNSTDVSLSDSSTVTSVTTPLSLATDSAEGSGSDYPEPSTNATQGVTTVMQSTSTDMSETTEHPDRSRVRYRPRKEGFNGHPLGSESELLGGLGGSGSNGGQQSQVNFPDVPPTGLAFTTVDHHRTTRQFFRLHDNDIIFFNATTKCSQLSKEELIQILKTQGTYNPDFMAWDVFGVQRFLRRETIDTYDPDSASQSQKPPMSLEQNLDAIEKMISELNLKDCDVKTPEMQSKLLNITSGLRNYYHQTTSSQRRRFTRDSNDSPRDKAESPRRVFEERGSKAQTFNRHSSTASNRLRTEFDVIDSIEELNQLVNDHLSNFKFGSRGFASDVESSPQSGKSANRGSSNNRERGSRKGKQGRKPKGKEQMASRRKGANPIFSYTQHDNDGPSQFFARDKPIKQWHDDVAPEPEPDGISKHDSIGALHVYECEDRGKSDGEGYLRMCGACRAIRLMPNRFFPPFINEVICDEDKACLYFYDYRKKNF